MLSQSATTLLPWERICVILLSHTCQSLRFIYKNMIHTPWHLNPCSLWHFLEQPSPSNRFLSSHSSVLKKEDQSHDLSFHLFFSSKVIVVWAGGPSQQTLVRRHLHSRTVRGCRRAVATERWQDRQLPPGLCNCTGLLWSQSCRRGKDNDSAGCHGNNFKCYYWNLYLILTYLYLIGANKEVFPKIEFDPSKHINISQVVPKVGISEFHNVTFEICLLLIGVWAEAEKPGATVETGVFSGYSEGGNPKWLVALHFHSSCCSEFQIPPKNTRVLSTQLFMLAHIVLAPCWLGVPVMKDCDLSLSNQISPTDWRQIFLPKYKGIAQVFEVCCCEGLKHDQQTDRNHGCQQRTHGKTYCYHLTKGSSNKVQTCYHLLWIKIIIW